MKMRDIMRPPSWTVRANDTLGRAEHIMARRRRRYLPVLDSGKLAGVLSERDILVYRSKTRGNGEWWLAPVAAVMHEAPPGATPGESAVVAGDRLAGSPDGLLPIVENGYLIGIVTPTDVLYTELRAGTPAPDIVTVADVMSEFPEVVTPTDSLVDAAKLMVDDQIRHLPVVDNGVVVGILSDRDIRDVAGDPVRFLASRDTGARSLKVRDAMTEDVVTVELDRPLVEVAELLADSKVGALPVVDDNGKPIGIVSYIDVLRIIAA